MKKHVHFSKSSKGGRRKKKRVRKEVESAIESEIPLCSTFKVASPFTKVMLTKAAVAVS